MLTFHAFPGARLESVSHHCDVTSIGRRCSARILSSLLLRGIVFWDEAEIREGSCLSLYSTMRNRMLVM
jgi:hypothetical protein